MLWRRATPNLKTSDPTRFREFDFRDEFSGVTFSREFPTSARIGSNSEKERFSIRDQLQLSRP
jgi:hypothetical protein